MQAVSVLQSPDRRTQPAGHKGTPEGPAGISKEGGKSPSGHTQVSRTFKWSLPWFQINSHCPYMPPCLNEILCCQASQQGRRAVQPGWRHPKARCGQRNALLRAPQSRGRTLTDGVHPFQDGVECLQVRVFTI